MQELTDEDKVGMCQKHHYLHLMLMRSKMKKDKLAPPLLLVRLKKHSAMVCLG